MMYIVLMRLRTCRYGVLLLYDSLVQGVNFEDKFGHQTSSRPATQRVWPLHNVVHPSLQELCYLGMLRRSIASGGSFNDKSQALQQRRLLVEADQLSILDRSGSWGLCRIG